MSDGELLRAYAMEDSEAAFAALVDRYLPLIHSVARRHLPDPFLAEEVSQAVFALLAKKSRSLSEHPSLAGWLHRTAWQIAARTARAEVRRRRRESEAASTLPSTMCPPELPEPATVLPAMDAALQELPAADRDALVLRYFLRKPMRDVGAALGTSEAAAKMRIRRALNQLKVLMARRGITCSPAALAAVMTQEGVTPAPASLAARVIPAATSGAPATLLPLILHGTLSLMNSTKLAVLIISAALVAGLSTLAVREQARRSADRSAAGGFSTDTPGASRTPLPADSGTRSQVRTSRGPSIASPEAMEAARQRLRRALEAPIPRSGITWPDAEVLDAMAAFEGHPSELFAFLKEVFLESAPQERGQRPLRSRAIRAMGYLDKSTPELTAFLWQTTQQVDWMARADAFFALRQLGLESQDLPALTRLLEETSKVGGSPALRRFVPDAIHQTFRKNPEAAAAYLPALVRVFENTSDSFTRFSAAAALLGTPQGSDPRVMETLRTGLREGLNASPTDYRVVNVGIAIERAAAAGPAARPLIPDLMDVARTSQEPHERSEAWLAIGKIQPELRTQIPELDQAMNRDTESRQSRQDVTQGIATPDDLVRALKDPASAVQAAENLGETGIHSPEVVPAMIAALDGMDQDSRERVVAAIQKLDPQVSVERVPFDVVLEGLIFADPAADQRSSATNYPTLARVLSDLRMFDTWRTPQEIVAATRKLAALDPATAEAFVNGIAEKDPKLAARARQQFAVPTQP